MYEFAEIESITYRCPALQKSIEVPIDKVYFNFSSCYGHSDDDPYCYCDTSKYIEITCECLNGAGINKVHTINL